jgi:hypothetical protein
LQAALCRKALTIEQIGLCCKRGRLPLVGSCRWCEKSLSCQPLVGMAWM